MRTSFVVTGLAQDSYATRAIHFRLGPRVCSDGRLSDDHAPVSIQLSDIVSGED
jgi:single-stranded DNA-specific DHH superfamily exonuclease